MDQDLRITGDVALAYYVATELAKGDNTIILGEAELGQLIAADKAILAGQQNRGGNP